MVDRRKRRRRARRSRRAAAKLPPRSQRALGHQKMRLGSERLYSRYGSFRVQGMWGSFAFDVAVQDESDAALHEAPGALDELARVDGAFRQVAPDLSDHEVELPWGDETDAGDLSELLAFLDGQGVSGPRAVLPTTATPAAAMWSSRAGAPLAAAIETGGMAVGEPAGAGGT